MYSRHGDNEEDSEELEEGEEVSQHSESSQYVKTRFAGRIDLCMICGNALFKYTCPKCQEKTCGLACLRKHKVLRNCSGICNATDHVRKNEINQKVVEKDFIFMKDMLSGSDKVKKTLSGVNGLNHEPKRFKIIRTNAKKMYNITINNAPNIIERHRENISFFFVKTKEFYWVIELLYFNPVTAKEHYSRHLTLPTSDANQIIHILPKEFLCTDLLEKGVNTQKIEEFNIFILNKVKEYPSASKKDLKKQSKESFRTETVELNRQSCLRECLIGMTLYEFPTLYIVHESLKSSFLSNKKHSYELESKCLK